MAHTAFQFGESILDRHRRSLAGTTDYEISFGITERTSDGRIYQDKIANMWNRNDQTHASMTTALEFGLSWLGATRQELLNEPFVWDEGAVDDWRMDARVTGFTIVSVIRDVDGSIMPDSDDKCIGATFKERIRQLLAVEPLVRNR
jgi:hypothetical protein